MPATQAPTTHGSAAATDRPNIIVVLADDLGFSDVGAYGSEIATPTLDRLARSGMLFTNFHAAPTCSPTRAMLLTGVDHHLAGLGNMQELMAENQRGRPGYEGHLNQDVVTVARLLQDSGYRTYMVGKWHLGGGPGLLPSDRGFERTFAMLEGAGNHFNDGGIRPFASSRYVQDGQSVPRPPGYSSDLFTDKLIEFLESNRGDGQPFFLYAAYTAPHWPLQAPEDAVERYKDRYQSGWDQVRAQRFERMRQLGLIGPELTLPPRWSGIPAWSSLSPKEQRVEARKMAVYAAMVSNLDDNLGRLLDYLGGSGQLENTLIVFLSDNGADAADLESRLPAGMSKLQLLVYRSWLWLNFDNDLANLGREDSFFSYTSSWAQVSSTPLFLFKGLVTEGGTRVPLIVHWPGRIAGETRSHAVGSVMDLTPTFLEAAGVTPPAGRYRGRAVHPIEGRSMMPVLLDETNRIHPDRPPLGFEFIGNGALISGEWKIFRINPPFLDGRWRLVRLKDDPRELEDLSGRYPARLARMLEDYEDYLRAKRVIPLPHDYFENWQ